MTNNIDNILTRLQAIDEVIKLLDNEAYTTTSDSDKERALMESSKLAKYRNNLLIDLKEILLNDAENTKKNILTD